MLRLVERHEVAVVYVRRQGEPPIEPELASRCAVVVEVTASPGVLPEAWRRRLRVLAAPISGVPSSVAAAVAGGFSPALERVAEEWRPDVVQFEHEVSAFNARRFRRPGVAAIVLVCHEPGGRAAEDLAGATNGRQRLAHRFDAFSWRRYWARMLPRVDAVVVFTERDRRAFEQDAHRTNFVVIPIGIDLPEQALDPLGSGEPAIAYVGGYMHPPNVDAALRLLRSIAPAVRRRVPRLRLLVVGADPVREMRDAAGPLDVVTGQVPDVNPYVDEAALLALPIRLGGGMRVKLLEALAAGKAVVATRLAAAGLDVEDGRELALAETDEEFEAALVDLLEDDQRRGALARNAREWALRNLSWDTRVEAYERLYRTLRRERR
jgi:glycosyltransferase involved in cell wall biosynthesis